MSEPLIGRQDKTPLVEIKFKARKDLADRLDSYLNYTDGDRDWALQEIISYVLGRDKSFAAWEAERAGKDDSRPHKKAATA